MLQGWRDLTLVHWPFAPDVVQRLLPDGFRVDTFDDVAWVGLVPFRMHRVRLPVGPALGPLSTFPETNVRTYVIAPDGRRGVWFFSLDITRAVTAAVARATYRVPYWWARMRIDGEGDRIGDRRTYTSRRRWPGSGDAASRVDLTIGAELAPSAVTDLDHFLTARWGLGTTFGRRLVWAAVDHPRWPLHAATLHGVDQTLLDAAGLPRPEGEPIVRWSPGVEVRIGRPRRLPGT